MKNYKAMESEAEVIGSTGNTMEYRTNIPNYAINDDSMIPIYCENGPVDSITPTDRELEAVRKVLNGETIINRVSHEKLENILGKTGKYDAHAGAWMDGEFFVNDKLRYGEDLGLAAHEAIEGETPGTSIYADRGLDDRHLNVDMKTIKALEMISMERNEIGMRARVALNGYKSFLMEGAMDGDPLSMEALRN